MQSSLLPLPQKKWSQCQTAMIASEQETMTCKNKRYTQVLEVRLSKVSILQFISLSPSKGSAPNVFNHVGATCSSRAIHMSFVELNTGLKTLLLQGQSESEFYGDLVDKFRKINVGKPEFSDHFSKIVLCYKRTECNIDAIKQSAGLAVNPITVDHFAYLFNSTSVGRVSDSMMPLT